MNEVAEDYLQQAITLMQQEQYEKAILYSEKALEADPRYKDAYSVKADALVNQGYYDQALKVYNQALLIDPNDGELYFNIGNIYVLLDDLIKCIKNYNKADQLGFRYVELYKNLADIYRQIEKPDMAISNYNKAILADPLRADIRLEKAGFQISQGKFAEALETLEELQSLEPDLYDAIVMRAEIYSGLKQYKKAEEVINDAVKQFPDDSALKVEKAKIQMNAGKLEEAMATISDLKHSDDFELVFRSALLVETQLWAMKEDLNKAKITLEEILNREQEPDDEVEYLLLNVEFALANYDRALQLASELSKYSTENLYTMSGKFFVPQILQKLGRNQEALTEYKSLASYFRRVTVNNPHFYEVYLYRILCHKELGEFEKALELADYVESLNPTSSDAFAMRYLIYKDMKQEDKAAEMEKIVAKLNPGLQL